MNFAHLIPLTAAVVNFFITLFVVGRGLRATVNRVYLVWGSAITVWNVGTYFMFRVETAEEAIFWSRFLQFGVILLPVSLFHLCQLIAQLNRPRLIAGAWIGGAVFVAANCTPLFVSGVRDAGYAWYTVGGWAFWLFTPFYALLTNSTIIMLSRHLRNLSPMHRSRVKSLLWANSTLIVFGTNDLLPILGVTEYPGTNLPIFPVGSLAAIFYGLLVGYSTLQHQLLDVHVALGRAAASVIRFGFLFVIALVLQISVALLAPPDQFSQFAFISSLVVLLVSTLAASLLFPRLLGAPLEHVERRLLGDRFEYQDQVRKFVESMTWYGDLSSLFNDLHDLLIRTLRLQSYQIILRDEHSRAFTLARAHPEAPPRQIPEIKVQSPVFQHFEWNKAEYLALNSGYARSGGSVIERKAREQLRDFNAELCLPLASENESFGIMLVGAKGNREPFTATDITLLVTLIKNLSLMVNQIRLKNQILHAQELDLLGRMSRGMAHDLNNLLTPVWTLLHLSTESGGEPLDEELLPVAMRNLQTMRAYIKEALFFSENLRPDFQLGRLDLVIKQAAELARASRKKEIEIAPQTPGEVLVEMDEVLVQRLMANLISNAIDASPAGSRVEVLLERLEKTESSRDWLRVRIVDHGEGIPKENLERILTPYFTTKNRGDENRGFGLGLAICRKIVNLHGGNLNITSQLRRGTTVQVDLPSRQVRPPVAASATPVS